MKICSPAGSIGSASRRLADPLASLKGAKLGILANNKPHADTLLEAVVRRIADRTGAELASYKTKNAALAH